MKRFRWILIALVVVLLLAAYSLKNAGTHAPPGPPIMNRAPAMTAPTSQEAADARLAALQKDLDPVPRLHDGKVITTPDGENWTRFENGVMIQELHIGLEGQPPVVGQTVSVSYVGTIPGTNREFDRSKPDAPLTFTMGTKTLIKGFSIGISTMHPGSKRRVYLPPELAYGEKGSPSAGIGPNQPLIFQIELLSVTGDAVELPSDLPKGETAGPPAPGTTTSAPATAPATQTH